MADTTTLDQVALAAFHKRITSIIPTQVRSCLVDLTEKQLWWRPNDESNSIGNLVLHMSGSMRHYLSRGIGQMHYERDRPAEFAEGGPVPKEQLLAIFDETIAQAVSVLDSFDTSRFTNPSEEPDYYGTVYEQILGIAIHMATHTGQIVYATKLLKEGSVDELWIRAHKA